MLLLGAFGSRVFMAYESYQQHPSDSLTAGLHNQPDCPGDSEGTLRSAGERGPLGGQRAGEESDGGPGGSHHPVSPGGAVQSDPGRRQAVFSTTIGPPPTSLGSHWSRASQCCFR